MSSGDICQREEGRWLFVIEEAASLSRSSRRFVLSPLNFNQDTKTHRITFKNFKFLLFKFFNRGDRVLRYSLEFAATGQKTRTLKNAKGLNEEKGSEFTPFFPLVSFIPLFWFFFLSSPFIKTKNVSNKSDVP